MTYREWWIEPEKGGYSFSPIHEELDPIFVTDVEEAFKRIDEIEADSCLYLEVE